MNNVNHIELDSRGKYIILVGEFFNGSTELISDAALLMSGKEVHSFITHGEYARDSFHYPGMEDAEVVDLRDYYVLPGLVDCHVHLALNGNGQDAIGGHLNQLFACGVLAVRDGGDRACRTLALANKNKSASGLLAAVPHIVASGCALRREKSYGSFLGPGLKSADDIKKMIACLADKGVGQIKVLSTGVVSFREYGKVGPRQFSTGELSYIVREASGYGLKVMAHVNSAQGVKAAALAGVHSVEHGYFLDGDCLKLMAERGVYWVPTIVPVANAFIKMKSSFSVEEQAVIERTYRGQQEMVCRAMEEGVKVAIGTDTGAPATDFGRSYIEELLLFREAGVEAADIICAATVTGAEVLGLNGNENGFLAFKKDPLSNLANLTKPDLMIR